MMKKDELEQVVRYYSKILRIQDWAIDVKITTHLPTDDEECVAMVQLSEEHMKATVLLKEGQPDTVSAIVHELLHIVFWNVSRKSAEQGGVADTVWESGLNRLTIVIVEGYPNWRE